MASQTQKPAKAVITDASGTPLNYSAPQQIVPASLDLAGAASSLAVLFQQDMTNYQSLSIQVVAVNGSLILLEWSNDAATWYTGEVKRVERLEVGYTQFMSSQGLFIAPKRGKYARVRISFFSGTAVQVQAQALNIPVDMSNWQGPPLPFSFRSPAASAGLMSIKPNAGVLKTLDVSNSGASGRYLKLFNETSVTMGATAAMREYYLPPGSSRQIAISSGGLRFTNAIQMAVTTALGLTDNTVAGIGAGEVLANGEFA